MDDLPEPGPVRLSPSRASDFKACPQLFKFRAIDRLPEPADPLAVRGSLVHAVLERLFRLPPGERTSERARELLQEVWAEVRVAGEVAALGLDADEQGAWLAAADRLLANHFLLEDPARVEIQELEWWVEHEAGRTLLRGIIDRVEVLPGGDWMLTDYKTGRSPSETRSFGSFFGLRFYALLCWRAFGKMPRLLKLVHLSEPEVLTLEPTPQMLEGLERQLEAIGDAVDRAHRTGDWRPRPGWICSHCPHRAICPAWAGDAPAEPAAALPAEPWCSVP